MNVKIRNERVGQAMTSRAKFRIAAAGAAVALGVASLASVPTASAVQPTTPVTGFTVWQGGNAYPSATSAVLQWNRWMPVDDQDPILDYKVSWAGGASTQKCPDSSEGTVYCTITGLTAGTAYTFSIVPQKQTGDGPSATMLSPTTVTPYDAPDQPVAPTITSTTTDSVTLGLTAPAGNGRSIASYEIYMATDNASYALQATTTSLTPTITGLNTAAHTYTFKFRAINSGGPGTLIQAPAKVSQFSDSSSTTPTVPKAPSNLLVSGVSVAPSSATVTWTAPPAVTDHPVTGYTVTASPGGRTCSVASATVSCTYSGANALDTGTSYTFSVTATNDLGTSPASLPSASVLIGETASAPQSLTGTVGDGQVVLNWTQPQTVGDTAISGYRIERSTSQSGPWVVQVADTGNAQTQQTITGLSNGQAYYFRVSAINSSGPGAQVTSSAYLPGAVPAAPTGVVATGIQFAPNSITVNWTAPSDPPGYPVTGYVVTSTPGGIQCVVPTATVTCTYAGSNALTAGTTYSFTVAAINGRGNGPASINSSPYLLGVVAGAPTDISATPTSGGAMLNWNPPTNDGGTSITGYRVQYATSSSGPWTTAVATTNNVNPMYQVTGLQNGTAYYFRITAINSSGLGASAVSAQAMQPGTIPPAPANVVASNMQANPSTATVSWTAPVVPAGSEVTSYTVTALPGGMTCQSTTTSCTFVDSNALTPSATYTFSVTATNGFGTSPASVASISYLIGDAPSAPSSVIAAGGLGQVQLSWGPPTETVTSYQVYLSTSSASGPWSVVSMNTGNLNANLLIANLVNGTQYWFRVTATNASGAGPAAVSDGVIPGGIPVSPKRMAVTDASSSSITASWLPVTDTRGSSIIDYTVTAFPGGQTCTTDTTECTVTGLIPGVAYQLWVSARNGFGSSDPFNDPAPVSAGTVPADPTGAAARATAPATARVSWAGNTAYGAAPVTYTVRQGSRTVCTTSATACTVKGLTSKTVNFSISASNAYGVSGSVSATATGIVIFKISLKGLKSLNPKLVMVGAAPKKAVKIVQTILIPSTGNTVKSTYKIVPGNSKKTTLRLRLIFGLNTVIVTHNGVTIKKTWNQV